MFKKVKNALRLTKTKKDKNIDIEYDFELKRKTTQIQYDENLKKQFLHDDGPNIDAQFDSKPLVEYTVQAEDSLQGISLMFDMSIELIKRLNNITDFVVQGMVIKVFQPLEFNEVENQLEEEENHNIDMWNVNQHQQQLSNILMYYCMDGDNVKGSLTIREDMILFDTNISQEQQQQHNKKRIIYNSCISISDINGAVSHIIKNVNGQYDYLVQILLSGIGRVEFEKKFRKQLEKYKKQKKSIATIFFRHAERDETDRLIPEEIKKQRCQSIAAFINSNAQSSKNIDTALKLTKLPYVDLIDESNSYKQLIQSEQLDNVIGERMGRLWASISYVPQYKANSECINQSLYKQLIELMPAIFRLSNWNIKFTLDNDGSSYQQLLITLKHENPFFFIVMDKDNNVFGAYVASLLQKQSKGFHGSGETFIFQKDQLYIIPYYWKEVNNDFVYCDAEGFSIGCGPSFGIFIDSKLEFGYNNPCTTFDNPRFTKEEKFSIKHLEIWTIEQM